MELIIDGVYVQKEVKMKCEECERISYVVSEFAECECGGDLYHINLIETVW